MEIIKYTKRIQKISDEFFSEENLKKICEEIKNNKTEITGDLKEFKVTNIEQNSWGIYVLFIQPKTQISSYEELEKLWETNEKKKKLNSPRVIQSRFQELNTGKNYCLYLGKSENLIKRINQHIHHPKNESTYGLRLSEHDEFIKNNSFAYSYFILAKKQTENLDAMKYLLVTLEKKLRGKLLPLIGKQ